MYMLIVVIDNGVKNCIGATAQRGYVTFFLNVSTGLNENEQT